MKINIINPCSDLGVEVDGADKGPLIISKNLNNSKINKTITVLKNNTKKSHDINDLRKFFEDTPDGSEIGVDTETTGLNFYQDKIVGLSLCNGKEALYVPINHKSSVYNTKLKNQIPEEDIRQLFKELKETKNYKWIKV